MRAPLRESIQKFDRLFLLVGVFVGMVIATHFPFFLHSPVDVTDPFRFRVLASLASWAALATLVAACGGDEKPAFRSLLTTHISEIGWGYNYFFI